MFAPVLDLRGPVTEVIVSAHSHYSLQHCAIDVLRADYAICRGSHLCRREIPGQKGEARVLTRFDEVKMYEGVLLHDLEFLNIVNDAQGLVSDVVRYKVRGAHCEK